MTKRSDNDWTPGLDGLLDLTGDGKIDLIEAAAYGGVFGGAGRAGSKIVGKILDDAADGSKLLESIKERRKLKGSSVIKGAKALDKGADKLFLKGTQFLDDAVAGIRRTPAAAKVIEEAGKAQRTTQAVGKAASSAVRTGTAAAKAAASSAKVTAVAGAKAAKPLAKPAARLAKPLAGAGALVEVAEGDATGAAAEVADAALLFAWPFGTAAVLGTMAVTTTYGLATGQSDYIAVGPTGLAERAITGD